MVLTGQGIIHEAQGIGGYRAWPINGLTVVPVCIFYYKTLSGWIGVPVVALPLCWTSIPYAPKLGMAVQDFFKLRFVEGGERHRLERVR